jgi:hypothetical protein
MVMNYKDILVETILIDRLRNQRNIKKLEKELGNMAEVRRVLQYAKSRASSPVQDVYITGVRSFISNQDLNTVKTRITRIGIKGKSKNGFIDISVYYLKFENHTMIMTEPDYKRTHKD